MVVSRTESQKTAAERTTKEGNEYLNGRDVYVISVELLFRDEIYLYAQYFTSKRCEITVSKMTSETAAHELKTIQLQSEKETLERSASANLTRLQERIGALEKVS